MEFCGRGALWGCCPGRRLQRRAPGEGRGYRHQIRRWLWVGRVGLRVRIRWCHRLRDSATLGLQHGSHLRKGGPSPSDGLGSARSSCGLVQALAALLGLLALDLGPSGLQGLAGLLPAVADGGHHRASGVLGVPVWQPGELARHRIGIASHQFLSDATCDTDLDQIVDEVQTPRLLRTILAGLPRSLGRLVPCARTTCVGALTRGRNAAGLRGRALLANRVQGWSTGGRAVSVCPAVRPPVLKGPQEDASRIGHPRSPDALLKPGQRPVHVAAVSRMPVQRLPDLLRGEVTPAGNLRVPGANRPEVDVPGILFRGGGLGLGWPCRDKRRSGTRLRCRKSGARGNIRNRRPGGPVQPRAAASRPRRGRLPARGRAFRMFRMLLSL